MAKDLVEKSLTTDGYDEPALFLICAQANFELGYIIRAEQMFLKCMDDIDFEPFSAKALGHIYMKQEKVDKAIEYFKRALELDSIPKTAGLIAKLYQAKDQMGEAL